MIFLIWELYSKCWLISINYIFLNQRGFSYISLYLFLYQFNKCVNAWSLIASGAMFVVYVMLVGSKHSLYVLVGLLNLKKLPIKKKIVVFAANGSDMEEISFSMECIVVLQTM